MEIWVVLSIGAAFFQNLRSMLQKQLKASLSNNGASFSRFIFAAPLVVLVLLWLVWVKEFPLPGANLQFAGYVVLGAVAQIFATILLVYLFGLRNFAVGNAFTKTETIQALVFGMVFLGDKVTIQASIALLVGLIGVVLISSTAGVWRSVFNRSALIGLASGAGFAVAGVSYRGASLALDSGAFFMRSTFTLATVLLFQTIVMGGWLLAREPGQFSAVLRSWRISLWVGFAGGMASMGWFAAMTLENAAYVKAVGQVELFFSIATSMLVFHEKTSRREVSGIILVSLGILLLLLWG